MFTADNTKDLQDPDLPVLNATLEALVAGVPDAAKRESRPGWAGYIRKAWRPSMTVEQLFAAAQSERSGVE